MGLCRIHHIAGQWTDGEFHAPDAFEAAERAFWGELLNNIPADAQTSLKKSPEAVRLSVMAGALVEDLNSESFNKVALDALPKLLTHRTPALRRAGEAPRVEHESKQWNAGAGVLVMP